MKPLNFTNAKKVIDQRKNVTVEDVLRTNDAVFRLQEPIQARRGLGGAQRLGYLTAW